METGACEITKFYSGKTILLTGGTGALGKMIVEKLLRTCKDVKKIHLLVRPKKGKDPDQRIHDLLEGPLMDAMKNQNTKYLEKVNLISCDLLQSNCGLSEESIRIIKNDVEIVIHCAATVRFDASLKTATFINLRATKYLLELANEIVNLKAFVYVSTAFSNCNRHQIKEKFYPPPIQPEALINLVESLDDKKIDQLTPILLEDWPNTYVFTKAITEGLIAQKSHNLPILIVRPSIVIASVREPIVGWIDNLYGPSGIVLATFLGLMRSTRGDPNSMADLVPADYVVNIILAAAYDRSEQRQISSNGNDKMIPIYNYCSSPIKPLKWREFMEYLFETGHKGYASPQIIWYPKLKIRKCVYDYKIATFLQQKMPAFLVDVVLYARGKKMQALSIMDKIFKISDMVSFFALREWEFGVDNTLQLWNRLDTKDKQLFNFNMANLDWLEYMGFYLRGVRLYIQKDPIETVPEGIKKMKKLKILHYSVVTLFYVTICYLLYFLARIFINI